MSAEFDYDPATDSLYIKLRPELSVQNRIVGEDVVIDLGADGEPVGYDIQHASQHAEAIAEALAYLRHRFAAEAHRQSGAVADSPQAREDQDFIDAIAAADAAVSNSRKRIDIGALRAMTNTTPIQKESAGEFVRRMRDEDRY